MAKKKLRSDGYVTMKCKLCSSKVERVDSSSKAVICWQCTSLYASGKSLDEIKNMTEKERGDIFVK
jgi:hypothetical protein